MQWEKGRVMEKSEEEFWMRERERERVGLKSEMMWFNVKINILSEWVRWEGKKQ